MASVSHKPLYLTLCLISIGVTLAQVAEEIPPSSSIPPASAWQDTRVETQAKAPAIVPEAASTGPSGFYPTSSDLALLGDYDYRRSRTVTQDAADNRSLGAMDIFPYDSGEQDFYRRNQDILQPLDRFLGWFTPHQTISTEFGGIGRGSILTDGTFPVFTRSLTAEQSHLKIGPLAFDLLWIGAGAIWSDYSGPQTFADGNEDGWLPYVDLAARGYIQMTESLSFSWLANLIYLPGENELALRNGYSSFPSISTEFLYQFRAGRWDVMFNDRFYARPGIDIFSDFDQQGIDRAGRYQFGYYDRQGRIGFFESEFAWFVNQASAQATRMFFDSDWRFLTEYTHWDMWRSFDFDDHTPRDTLSAQLGYEGNDIPFAPMIRYQGSSYDGYQSFIHQVYLQLNGRITENVRLETLGGYYWTNDFRPEREGLIWRTGLIHDFSKRGQHGIVGGQMIVEDPFSPETLLTNYVRYFMNYQISQRLQSSAYIQYGDSERLVSASGDPVSSSTFNNYISGATLSYRPLDFTQIVGRVAYQSGDGDFGVAETERWLYRIQVMQRLASRVVLESFYQFDDFTGGANYQEHAVGASLRCFF